MKRLVLVSGFMVFLMCALQAQTIFYEDFTTTAPADWVINENNPGEGKWVFDNPGGRTFNSEAAANGFAIIDSDDLGSGNEQDSDLISPNIDISGESGLWFSFDHYYKHYSGSLGTFSYSTDNGMTWTKHTEWTSNSTNGDAFVIELSALVGNASHVKFKWHYEGSFDYYWCVDNIKLFKPSDMELANAEVSNLGNSYVVKGQTNAVMASVKITTDGQNSPLSTVTLRGDLGNTTTISDVIKLSAYKGTGTSSVTASNLVGEVTLSDNEFDLDITHDFINGNNNFIICYDIALDANADNLVDFNLIELVAVNSTVLVADGNPAGEKPVREALQGTYTINQDASTTPDFNSIEEAVDALDALGVMGAVTFELAPGTYDERIVLEEYVGMSEVNRVSFKGMGASCEEVVIYSDPGYLQKSTLTFDGADYFTFENLKLTIDPDHYATIVQIKEGACYNFFENVIFEGAEVTSATYSDNKHLVYSPSSDNLDHGSHFNNCTFLKGYIALHLRGINNLSPSEEGLMVTNCFFEDQYSKSIYTNYMANCLIQGNTFRNNTDLKNGFQAIDFYRGRENVVIDGNDISISFDSKSATGIEFRPGTGSEDLPLLITNNIVRVQTNASYAYPIIISDDETDHLYVAHNTCIMEGSSAGSGCIFLEDEIIKVNVYNNLLINNAGGYVLRVKSQALTGTVSDHNICSFTGEYFAKLGTDELATLNDWTTATSKDLNSRLENPSFVSVNDFHIQSDENMRVNHPLALVNQDIDGDPRSTQNPCAGADEIPDLAPFILNPVSDILFTDFPDQRIIDLSNTFSDPDNDDDLIEIQLLANSNSSLVEAVLNEEVLTVSRLTDEVGDVTLTIRAMSNGLTIDMEILVKCLEVTIDQPPVIAVQAEDVVFTLFPENISIDLSDSFTDPDNNDDLIALSIENNSNLNDVEAQLVGEELHIDRLTMDESMTVITVRALSNGLYVDMNINVQCIEFTPDQAPVIDNQIETVIFTLFPEEKDIDLSGVFSDPDGDEVTISFENNSNTTDLNVEFEENALHLTRLTPDEAGALLTVRATSNDLFVEMVINVILEVYIDKAPIVINELNDIVFIDHPMTKYVSLANVFTDPDNDDEDIVITLESNSNISAVYAEVEGLQINLSRLTPEATTADLVLRATSNEKYVETDLRVILENHTGVENHTIRIVSANPCADFIRIECGTSKSLKYDIIGIRGELSLSGISTEGVIDVSTLNAGVYVLLLFDNKETFSYTFIKH
jgi:hypothetical protein